MNYPKLRLHIFVLVAGMLLSIADVAVAVADRLLIEINHIAYTQRQMELYLLCKDAMSNSDSSKVRIASSDNWTAMIKEFVSDMIIDQEALRLGSYDPSRPMLEKGIALIAKRKSENPEIARTMASLGADAAGISRFATQAVRIEAFRRSRQRQAAVSDEKRPSSISVSTKFNAWLKDIEDRAIVRYFADAEKFTAISFAAN